MKKIFLALIVLSLLSSCNYFKNSSEFENYEFDIPYDLPYLYCFNNEVITVLYFVTSNIRYERDITLYRRFESWATPEEVFNNKAGDCEDFSILALYLLKRDFDIKGELVVALIKKLEDDNINLHVLIRVDGIFYEPQTFSDSIPYEIVNVVRVFTYAEAIKESFVKAVAEN